MAISERYKLGSFTGVMSTELNGLVNNGLAISSPYNNSDGYMQCDVQLTFIFNGPPIINSGISLWFLSTLDGVVYEDGSSSVTPGRMPEVVFPVRNVSGIQLINRRVLFPWGTFKILVKNDGTGQSFASSGNFLHVRPVTLEVG